MSLIEEIREAILKFRAQGPVIKYVRMSSQTLELFKDSPLRNTSCSPFPFGAPAFTGVPIVIDECLPDGIVEPEYREE